MLLKKSSVIFLSIVLLSFQACKKSTSTADNSKQQNTAPLFVNGFVTSAKKITNSVVSSGTLLAAEQIEIHPEISGRITSLNIEEGRTVTKGTLLVKLYDGDLQAQLKKFIVQKENAEKIFQRSKLLLEKDAASQADYDLVETQLKGAMADIELTHAQIQKTEIRAPFTGKIGLRNVSPGAYVSPTTLIANLQQIDPLKIDFYIPEKYSSQVSEGRSVNFSVDGFDEKFTGKIYAIEPGIDQATRSIKIRAYVTNVNSKLHPGAFAKVNIDIKDINALMVPTQSIIPQTRGKQVIVVKNGKASYTKVETGIRDQNNIQVLSGLEIGDTIVTTGLMFLKPDAPVKISKIMN